MKTTCASLACASVASAQFFRGGFGGPFGFGAGLGSRFGEFGGIARGGPFGVEGAALGGEVIVGDSLLGAGDMTYNFEAPQYEFTAPQYEFTAPQYEFTAPQYEFTAPQYEFTAPQYEFTAPQYEFTVPEYEATASPYEFEPSRTVQNLWTGLGNFGDLWNQGTFEAQGNVGFGNEIAGIANFGGIGNGYSADPKVFTTPSGKQVFGNPYIDGRTSSYGGFKSVSGFTRPLPISRFPAYNGLGLSGFRGGNNVGYAPFGGATFSQEN